MIIKKKEKRRKEKNKKNDTTSNTRYRSRKAIRVNLHLINIKSKLI